VLKLLKSGCLIAFFLFFFPSFIPAEEITITTYYPSPYGSYNYLQADKLGVGDNNGDNSWTSADVPTTAGDVWIKGKVGIGTINPASKLQIGTNTILQQWSGSTPYVLIQGMDNEAETIAFQIKDENMAEQFRVSTIADGGATGGKVYVGGSLGIGTASPIAKLEIAGSGTDSGPNGNLRMTNRAIMFGGGNTTGYEANSAQISAAMHAADSLCIVGMGTAGSNRKIDLWAEGGMTLRGSFSASGVKSFIIDHPSKPNYKLIHAAIEGPEAAVYYRGQAKLTDGQAVVRLPDYFEALTRKEGRTVQVTAKGIYPYLLSATEVRKGSFKVFGTNPDGEFYWEVKALRADVEPLKVEKPKEQKS